MGKQGRTACPSPFMTTSNLFVMNKRNFTIAFIVICCCLSFNLSTAQDAAEQPPKEWETGAGIGLDFSQLFQLNPKQGAGQNRLGFGSAVNLFAKYRKDRLAWDNTASWQFGIQRLGSGVLDQNGETQKIPFQKSIDELRLNSKVGYQSSETSKWFYATDFSFLRRCRPTKAPIRTPTPSNNTQIRMYSQDGNSVIESLRPKISKRNGLAIRRAIK